MNDSGLRYFSAADVARCLPPVAEQLDLTERVFLEKARHCVDMPPKPYITCRTGDYHLALPAGIAALRQVGIKWVSTYESNPPRGLPYIHGLVVLSDWDTGAPVAIVEGRSLTGVRTAAVTGLALRALAAGRGPRVTFVGTGEQARYHLPILAHAVPGLELVLFDAAPERAEAFAAEARRHDGVASAVVASDLEEAVRDARILITSATYAHEGESPVRQDVLADDCLLVAIDWDVMVPPATACAADLFIVDDHEEYATYRDEEPGSFDDWPRRAHLDLGEVVVAAAEGTVPGAGVFTLVTLLGAGAADIVLASAVSERARREGLGVTLPA